MNHIANNLLRLRKERGLSQDRLAQQLHVTRQTISSWETGRTVPGVELLDPIARALDVTLPELLAEKPISSPTGRLAWLFYGFSLFLCAAYVLLMGFSAWTLIYNHQQLLEVTMGLTEVDSLSSWAWYGNIAVRIAMGLVRTAALVFLIAAGLGRLPFRRRTLYLGAFITMLAAALAILPFWLQSGWPPVNYYLEWFLTVCGLLFLFLLDAGIRLVVKLIQKRISGRMKH